MTTTINASTSSGLIQTADTSGVLQLQSNGTSAAGVSGSDFQMNSGFGSVATAYGCRAWVNFNGTGTPAIRANGNVSSITDNGTGDYTINFTTAMPDANYLLVGTCNLNTTGNTSRVVSAPRTQAPTTTAIRIATTESNTTASEDMQFVYVAIFR